MKETLYVIKVGGKILETPDKLELVLDQFASIKGKKILVHGGGRTATQLAEKLGIEAPMVNGRRITSDDMMEIAVMVYGGLMSKNLVARLQARRVNALGLSGADLNLILAHKRPVKDIDYGWAGDVDALHATHLDLLLSNDIVPVFAPLTHNGKGQMLNTNADTIASTVARGMTEKYEVTLAYIFEMPGVMKDPDDMDSLISFVNPELFKSYQANGEISGGMIPKLSNAFEAIDHGVSKVLIGRYDAIDKIGSQEYIGTTLSNNPS
ncbi:MAG: acetylglutamate kinase [Bacteroidota bacterium]